MAAERADAEINIVARDNVGATMSRILTQVRAMGQAVGASNAAIEKGAKGASRAMGQMLASTSTAATANSVRGLSAVQSQMSRVTAQMAQYEALAKRAGGLRPSATSFSGWRLDGQGVKASTAREIQNATRRYAELNKELQSLQRTQFRMQQTAAGIGPSLLSGGAYRRDRATLQGLYNNMWGGTAAAAATPAAPPPITGWRRVADVATRANAAISRSSLAVTERFMGMSMAARYLAYDVSRNLGVVGGVMAGLGVASIVIAARWERAFADVERTTGASGAQLDRIRVSLIDLSQTLPVGFTQLTEIASLGAQMGIAADGIVNYTRVIAQLTATTNLTAQAAGTALGRFQAFYSEADDPSLAVSAGTFTNLASAILKVGVNSVATESGIVNVSTQISSMARYAGMTADQTIGLAGALSSVGVPPELSRGVITRLFNNMGEAMSEGGVRLQEFARIAGVSSTEFKAAWGTEQFGYMFTRFSEGLNGIQQSGGDAVRTLHELGITSVRDVPVLLRLSAAAGEAGVAGSLLAQTMNDARSGWRDNIELALHYSKISETVASKAKVLVQNFESLFAAMGEGSSGPAKSILNFMNDLVRGFTVMARDGGVLTDIGAGLTILLGGILLLSAGATRAVAGVVGFGQALQMMNLSAEAVAARVSLLTKVIAGFAIAGTILIAAFSIGAMANAARDALNPISDVQGALEAMRKDTDSGSVYRKVALGVGNVGKEAATTATQASNLSRVLGENKDEAYGASDGYRAMSGSLREATLNMGQASLAFMKSQMAQKKEFQDLFKPENQVWIDRLNERGFDLDRFYKIVIRDGEKAGEDYLKAITGVDANRNIWDDMTSKARNDGGWGSTVDPAIARQTGDIAHLNGQLLTMTQLGTEAFQGIANQTSLAEAKLISFRKTGDMTFEAQQEWLVQNQDAVDSLAESYSSFTAMDTLIEYAQELERVRKIEDAEERAEAAKNYEDGWEKAYGGAAFSLSSYMEVFRRAAEEQARFRDNLSKLRLAGVDEGILGDIQAMGAEGARLAQALVEASAPELQEFIDLYGRTGHDAMVSLAAGQLMAEHIVTNIMANLGFEGVQRFNQELAAGASVEQALENMQLQANGMPITAEVKAFSDRDAMYRYMQHQADSLGIVLPITPYLTRTSLQVLSDGTQGVGGAVAHGIRLKMASGGWTGPGQKYAPRGLVHADEFVMPKESVRNIGVDNLYALMRATNGGRRANSSNGGFAGGGLVGNGGTMIVELSPRDRALLQSLQPIVTIGTDVVSRANTAANFGASRQGRG